MTLARINMTRHRFFININITPNTFYLIHDIYYYNISLFLYIISCHFWELLYYIYIFPKSGTKIFLYIKTYILHNQFYENYINQYFYLNNLD
jgi:hypothetical protein